uniref:PKD domain-containing protein n=1 Tax=Archaeoglobus fulgidus TaxID=2234 RepID=A0A7J2TLY8_ARCFL
MNAIDKMKIEGFNASFNVRMTYGRDCYGLTVDFGDGSSVSDSISYGQKLTMNHSYQQSENYVITARAFNGDHSCSVATPVLIDPFP